MKQYKILINMGHQGAGKSLECTKIIKAKNIINALDIAKKLKGAKKGKSKLAKILSIKEIN